MKLSKCYNILPYPGIRTGIRHFYNSNPREPGNPILFGDVSKVAGWIRDVMNDPWNAPRKGRDHWGSTSGVDLDKIWNDYGR